MFLKGADDGVGYCIVEVDTCYLTETFGHESGLCVVTSLVDVNPLWGDNLSAIGYIFLIYGRQVVNVKKAVDHDVL